VTRRDPNPDHDTLVPYLLRGLDSDEGICLDFIKEAISRFGEDDEEQYQAIFTNAMVQLSSSLSKISMNDDYKPYMDVRRAAESNVEFC